ncbi:MAG: PspA/IM30 family protein [Pseudomonadota bacterium]
METINAIMILEPDPVQQDALAAYMARYAEAGSWLAGPVFEGHITDQVRLHRRYYNELRGRFELPAQSAVLCLKHVARLCRRAPAVPVLSPLGPVPYDRHLYGVKAVDQLSLATLAGRVVVPTALSSYQAGELAVGSGELLYEEDNWIFSLRTTLSRAALDHAHRGKEPVMSDKLLTRVTRLISGIAHNTLSHAEQAAAVPVMEQAVRDIDDAIKDVRAEIGQNEATKYNVTRRITELRGEHGNLDAKIATALGESQESLAEAGVARQLDIENQLALLNRTLEDAEGEIAKLTDSLNALRASRREAQQRLKDLKSAPPAAAGDSGGGAPGRSATAKADEAIESAQRLGEDLTGVPGSERPISNKELEDLDELHRQHAIRERLAKHRAGLKADH